MNQVATMPREAVEPSDMLSVIARAVADPAMDVDKAERLFALRKEILADAARKEFNVALREAKSAMRPVLKNKYNEQTKSSYANLEAVAAAIDPVIDAHGFVLTYGTGIADKPNHYRVTADLLHDGGHERPYYADIPEDTAGIKGTQNKTATHGFGSTMSYGRRYLKLMIFDLATTDDNDGNRRNEPDYVMIDAKQCAELRRLIASAKTTEEAFCRTGNIGTLPEMAADQFELAKGVLVKRIEAMRSAEA